VVESQPSKLLVAGSIPVSRSIRLRANEPTRYGVMADAALTRRRPSFAREDRARASDGRPLRPQKENGRQATEVTR
jgi:hypothetical protein